MVKEKIFFKKNPLLLDFFYTCPAEPKEMGIQKGTYKKGMSSLLKKGMASRISHFKSDPIPSESKNKSEVKGKSESKGRPESKAGSAKERLFVEQGIPTNVGNRPLSLSLGDSKKEAWPEEVGFATRTQEISFEDFLKLRTDKETY